MQLHMKLSQLHFAKPNIVTALKHGFTQYLPQIYSTFDIHPEITTVGLHVTKNCHLGHPLYLSPVITVHASHIRHLRIDDAEMWVDAQLTELMGIGALDTLEVHGAMGLSEKFFEEVAARHGKTLQTLKLTGVRRMDDIALMSRVVPCARGMRVLDLSGSIRTWSRTMEEYSLFQQGGRALVELDVSQCVGLPAQFFHVLARVSPRLERLVASETCFGDGEMEALLHPANRLSSLKIANCNNLTLGFWTVLKSAACYLKDLDVQGSRGTIEDGMAPILAFHSLKKLSPTLATVSVGPIVNGKSSFSHWCILANAEKYVAFKRGLLDGFIPNSCGRYLELPVKRLIRAMESLQGDSLVSPFFST
ncbi:hypothetical protein BCR33DRAFT_421059 [Rhizoclosmatium globosum]|uniref:RNI-like protein n=1 Tax=Rhizoclosmatium globosum TaxID=329046 RepID=A0A1Y2BVK6_9FUNG|nr:hypothetical protein BCR33DRAFT_421059 [Rhizoclosmatium globosum]|eukprot:ORY38790.1 hypothetical protein BCR33DRAFT_421059 [Rhizoclosmatium globosum]